MTDAPFSIQAETAANAKAVRQVHVNAFPTRAEADLVDRLRDNQNLRVSLVAECEGKIVGHIAFSPVRDDSGANTGLGLAPVAVLPDYQRQGIGGRLIEAGLQACRETGAAYVVVLGDPACYSRFGFIPAIRHGLTCEYTDGDAFQVIELRDGALNNVTGLIRYADEFNAM